jgi:hypothetical protein
MPPPLNTEKVLNSRPQFNFILFLGRQVLNASKTLVVSYEFESCESRFWD